MATAITNVRVFDGETVLEGKTVVIEGKIIRGIDVAVPSGATTIDGTDCTLLPGLIDAHTHSPSEDLLKLALKFGVTTELEMAGHWELEKRAIIAEDDTLADLRTADAAMTPPGGHPREISERIPAHMLPPGPMPDLPSVSSVEEAAPFVADRIAAGADYLKFMIEDGCVLQAPGLPLLSDETLVAGVAAAHKHGKIAVAHALTQPATAQALRAGMDGLAHLFIDGLATDEIVQLFKEKGAFVTPCACLNASTMGLKPTAMLEDERVTSRLPKAWLDTLGGSFDCYRQGSMKDVLGSIKALHGAGIDILAGTDVSTPVPTLGGLAHGASVHHELQLFVEAGLTPVEALKAATSVTARRFRLDDRGRIAAGLRADLLLVKGDPTRDIRDTSNINAIWRRGTKLYA